MSDYNSSLPVRTQNNGDVAAKIVDGTTPSQALAVDASGRLVVKLDDGAGNLITSQVNGTQQALDVGINVAGVQIDPRAIRALTSSDVVTANQGAASTAAAGWFVKPTDGTNSQGYTAAGEAKVSVTQPLPAGTNIIGKVSQDTSPWIVKDLADGSVTGGTAGTFSLLAGAIFNSAAPTLTTGQQASLQSDASGNLKVVVAQPLPAGTNALGSVLANIQVAGAAVTPTNPVPVTISSTTPGTAIASAQTSASVAAASTANLQYTVTAGKTLNFSGAFASASGKIKVVISIETAVASGTFTTKYVGFNSTANPNVAFTFNTEPTVAAGVRVQAAITNLDLLSQDVYCTFEGTEN